MLRLCIMQQRAVEQWSQPPALHRSCAAAAALIAKLLLLLNWTPLCSSLCRICMPCYSAQPSPAAFFLESLLKSSGPCSSGAPAPPAPDSLPDGDSAITAPALGLSLAQPAAILSCGKQQHSGGSHARESGDILPLPLPPPAPQNSRCWQGGGGGGPTRTPHTGGQSHAGGGDLGDGSRPKTCGQPLTNGKGVRANFLDPFLQPHPYHLIPPLPCCSPTPG